MKYDQAHISEIYQENAAKKARRLAEFIDQGD
jgi:hypothetical protein